LLLITQPKYFKEVFNLDLTESTFLASLPHLVMTIIVPFGGQVSNGIKTFRRRRCLT
jgi:MFS transporter, ACS family, solute carrier family 17 (sodium-dependent inorganic phosphate cotransporter), member 6/7/8